MFFGKQILKSNDCRPMLPFQIKICGVTNVDDTSWACECGADAVGLNFYQKSKRFVDFDQAFAIAAAIDRYNKGRKSGTAAVKKVGVFVEMPVADLLETSLNLRLDGIQLHGDEEPGVVNAIRSGLSENGQRCFLIRAIRSLPKDLASAAETEHETERLSTEIERWVSVGIDVVLLDAAMPGEYGGTGKVVDIANISRIKSDVPLVLAGGLNPSNVAAAIEESGLAAVDVASGVELAPGFKDPEKVKAFVHCASRSFQENR